ncbi:uncharacterized protein LOC108922218 isoform X3 [Scleropages formosus]|uniref:uncharacterized protein LOC108922218 isoform X3 n=1 Tax=Scleropages formosus TaxID=113540 RepID=UPI00087843BC|nr:uncharacterized protein LOC108922218 isoform X3 [Scleropages formosus]XP_018587720.1 uncharacterized protein LOC108922218 isoform X3 [Scleropages formosus]
MESALMLADSMSSGYTIDIQLTELGFPDLFKNEDMGVKKLPTLNGNSPSTPVSSPDSQISSSPSPNIQASLPGSNVPSVFSDSNTQISTPASMKALSHENSSYTDISLRTGMQLRPRTRLNGSDTNLTNVNPALIQHDGTASARLISEQDAEVVLPISHHVGRGGRRHSIGNGKEQAINTCKNSNTVEKDTGESETDSDETEDSDVPEEDIDNEDEYDEKEETMYLADVPGDKSGEHRCRVCDLTLPSAFLLREHMHLHSGARPYRCSECGKQFCHLANYRIHLRNHAQATPIRCRVCKAIFQSVESLQTHLEKSHLEKEFYQCDFCKRIFTCLNECQRHLELHRQNLMRHQCPQCERHFRRHKSLTRHLAQHNRQRTYLCTECGQAFPKKNILFRHSFSHLGLLPYTCVRCQRHFRLASLYHKHECKPERIQCVACLGFFHSQRDFQRHKKETGCWGHQGAKGDEIRCMECGQAFGSVGELKKHAGAHQRVLTCSECGKGFRSALLLMSHMGGHASQRPYLCQRCGLGFPHQQAYDSHQKDCGRLNPSAGALKKPKMTELAKSDPPVKTPVKDDKSVEDTEKVWTLTLDKMPPPGAALIVYLPVPTNCSTPPGATLSKTMPGEDAIKATVAPLATFLSTKQNLLTETDPLGSPGAVLQLKIPANAVMPGAMQFAEGLQPLLTLDYDRDCTSVSVPSTTVGDVNPKVTSLTVVSSMSPQIFTETGNSIVAAEGLRVDLSRIEGPGFDQNYVTHQKMGHAWESHNETGVVGRTVADAKVMEGEEGNMKQTTVLLKLEKEGSTGICCEVGEQTGEYMTFSKKEEKGMMIQMKNKPLSCRQYETISTFPEKEEPYATDTGCVEPGDSRTAPFHSLIAIKCEMGSTEGINLTQAEDNQGGRENREDNKEGGTRGFDCVEVEIRDDVERDGETEDEPHECINCGRILLDGNLLEHYMQHAAESDCAFPEESCETWSEPHLPSPPPSLPRKERKPRKKR